MVKKNSHQNKFRKPHLSNRNKSSLAYKDNFNSDSNLIDNSPMMDFDNDTNILTKLRGESRKNKKQNNNRSEWNYEHIIKSEETIRKIKKNKINSQLKENTNSQEEDANLNIDDKENGEQTTTIEEEDALDNAENVDKFENEVYAKNVTFSDFKLSKLIIKALAQIEFFHPTKVQEKVIPLILKGHDVLVNAETGSGKTACFLLPTLQKIITNRGTLTETKALVILPTRELALQCSEMLKSLANYLEITYVSICGGMSVDNQITQLKTNPDIIIATPGRLIDVIYNYSSVYIEHINIIVLDEADKLLELGFKDAIMEILELIKNNKNRQTLLFSATLNAKIIDLGKDALKSPIKIKLAQSAILSNLKQSICRMNFKEDGENDFEKRMAYLINILKLSNKSRTIIFFNTKKDCHKAYIILNKAGLSCSELHSNIHQSERLKSLDNFQKGKVKFLLATDIAGRGIDINKVRCVINFQMPLLADRYIHRIGRTARKGYIGEAITICDEKDRSALKKITRKEKFICQNIKIDNPHIKKVYKDILADKDFVDAKMKEDEADKELELAEKDVEKTINMKMYNDQIKNKPKKKWFENKKTKKDKERQMKKEFNDKKAKLFE